MYKNIAVAYDESPEAGRCLTTAIQLAKCLGTGLQAVTVMEKLPAYTAFAAGADASMTLVLEQDRLKFYEDLQAKARATAAHEGIDLAAHLLDGEAVDAIVNFVCRHKVDLIVIGIHRRPGRVSSMWSTVYAIAQNVPCSVLGVH